MPNLDNKNTNTDFYFIKNKPENIALTIIKLVKSRIPAKFRYNILNDIQVLSPMQKGATGVRLLNIELPKALNQNVTKYIEKFGQKFALGDKVMQIVNNYDKDVFNGDIGFIVNFNADDQNLTVCFKNNNVLYS